MDGDYFDQMQEEVLFPTPQEDVEEDPWYDYDRLEDYHDPCQDCERRECNPTCEFY